MTHPRSSTPTRTLPPDTSGEKVAHTRDAVVEGTGPTSVYELYARTRPNVSRQEFEHRLAGGIVLLHDLRLDAAQKILADGDSAAPPRTKDAESLQRIIDGLCSISIADSLTGLFNRRYFDHRLRQEIQRAQRAMEPCSVMIVDADHFKNVNDDYGHTAGDHVLQGLARIMQDALRATDDITSRFGGEEFAMILPGATSEGALIAAERMRVAIEHRVFEADGHELHITVSAGIATYDPTWANVDAGELIKQADSALYQAKNSGRNCIRVYGGTCPTQSTKVTAEEKDLLFG